MDVANQGRIGWESKNVGKGAEMIDKRSGEG